MTAKIKHALIEKESTSMELSLKISKKKATIRIADSCVIKLRVIRKKKYFLFLNA